MIPQLIRRPLLVKDEERSLADRARKGDEAARRKVIEANMRLVCGIAKQYQTQQAPFEDLVQEGAIGLMKAVDRFDPERGYRFSTYAIYWIKQSIRKAVNHRSRVIRLPAHAVEERKRLIRIRDDFEASNGRAPTREELADICGFSIAKVARIVGTEHDCLSLDGQGATDFVEQFADVASESPESAAIRKSDHESLRKFLARLTPRERSVLVRRLGLEPNSIPDDPLAIARDLGMSRFAVQQAVSSAIRSLRRMVEEEELGAR